MLWDLKVWDGGSIRMLTSVGHLEAAQESLQWMSQLGAHQELQSCVQPELFQLGWVAQSLSSSSSGVWFGLDHGKRLSLAAAAGLHLRSCPAAVHHPSLRP